MISLESQVGFGKALKELLLKIQDEFAKYAPAALPIKMYIAGGAALYLWTGERSTEDIDATFSKRVLFGRDMEISYRDIDGQASVIYLDRNYNDTLGLMHEDAEDDSVSITIKGIDKNILDVRVLSPLDLAVSKLSRFSDEDREDIISLAKIRLIDAKSLRSRAESALTAYVGNVDAVSNTIKTTCHIVESINPQ